MTLRDLFVCFLFCRDIITFIFFPLFASWLDDERSPIFKGGIVRQHLRVSLSRLFAPSSDLFLRQRPSERNGQQWCKLHYTDVIEHINSKKGKVINCPPTSVVSKCIKFNNNNNNYYYYYFIIIIIIIIIIIFIIFACIILFIFCCNN